MPKRLTEQSVGTLKPKAKPFDVYDAVERHLFLKVGKFSRAWRVVYKNADGIKRSKGIGHWPEVDVKNARIKAAAFKVAEKERIANPPETATLELSFREIAENYLNRHVDASGLRSARQIRNYFNVIILPEFEGRSFVSVRRGDIVKLLDKVEDERGARTADLILAYVRHLASWHQSRDEDYQSPIARKMQRTKPSERRRKRILSDDEVRIMWAACDQLGVFGGLVRLLLLTAQRRAKVATMMWTDLDGTTWNIRTERGEKGNAERLVLPQMALDVINSQSVVDGNPYVFPASYAGRRDGPGRDFGSYCAFGDGKKALDALMRKQLPDMPEWRLHDLRRTARSLMARCDVASEVAEKVLGHALPGIEATYNLHDYAVQKTAALNALAALITRIINPPADNVVAIRHRELA